MEDGDFGSVVTCGDGANPIFKGVCSAEDFCGSTTGNRFNFSGKFGSTGAETSGASFNSPGAPGVLVVGNVFGGSE